MDWERLWKEQEAAWNGENAWKLDPLKVAKYDAPLFGFDSSNDKFVLASRSVWDPNAGTGVAVVMAVHDGRAYAIQLIQPFGPGPWMIWTINSIREITDPHDKLAAIGRALLGEWYPGNSSSWRDQWDMQYIKYVVEPGDTLWRIATRYGASVAAIMEINNITDANAIWVGQVLNIPR